MITGDSNPDKEVESIAHRLGCVLILAVSSGVEEHTTQGVLISPLAVGTHSNRSGPGTGSKCPPMGQSGHDLHLEQGLGKHLPVCHRSCVVFTDSSNPGWGWGLTVARARATLSPSWRWGRGQVRKSSVREEGILAQPIPHQPCYYPYSTPTTL
uniref:Uncharacterized protein n=1 Tax=Oryza sativa subsp. japonica TaxID=39947 RepID=Q2QSD8_ORYSJ|nr:hypothetical protein LOC_Os12g24460 [Oryza sativa Japonica Group]